MMSDKKYKNFLFRGVALLLLFLPAARAGAHDWAMSLAMILGAPLVFIWLLRTDNSKKHKFKRTSFDLELFIFGAIVFLSFVFSINKYRSLYVFLGLAGCIGIYYLLVDNFSRDMWRKLLGLVIFIGTGLSFYGLLQYFGYLSHFWWISGRSLASTYVNHNHFAGYLELIIPLTLGFIFDNRKKALAYRLVLIAALALMVSAFVLSQSREAWLCLSASLIVMGVLLLRRAGFSRRRIVLLFLLVIFVFVLISFISPQALRQAGKIMITDSEKESVEDRYKIWQGSISMIKDKPLLGWGVGTFAQGFLRFKPKDLEKKADFAYNDYIQVAAESGVFGLIAILWILVFLLREGFAKGNSYPLVLGCVTGNLSFCLHSFLDFNFYIPANMFLFIVYSAFIMSGEFDDTSKSNT